MRNVLPLLALSCWVALAACDDDKKKEKLIEKVAGPSASNTEPPPPPKPPPDRVPDISVDSQGVYAGGERVDLKAQDAPQKLAALMGKFPIEGKTVALSAMRSAPTGYVVAVVNALSERNASELIVKTQDRAKKDATIKLVPEKKLGKIPECTIVTMMRKERTTASWSMRGGNSIGYPKGMAGPDMSLTLDGITKQVNGCTSTALLFSGDDSVEWGLTFDLGHMVASAQPPLKTTTYALLHEAPVAGRAVKLSH